MLTHIRRFPRVKVNLPVDFTLGSAAGHTRATNLGGGGLFLGILEKLIPDTELALHFHPARHLSAVDARGRVRHQIPEQGVGIEFSEIKPEDRTAILRLILHRLGDKRRHPRAPLAVQVEHAGGVSIGLSRDISVGGMFIETKESIPGEPEPRLRFNLDDNGPIVTATAKIAYECEKLGMGLEFTELSRADRERIDAYVAKSETRN